MITVLLLFPDMLVTVSSTVIPTSNFLNVLGNELKQVYLLNFVHVTSVIVSVHVHVNHSN